MTELVKDEITIIDNIGEFNDGNVFGIIQENRQSKKEES